METGKTYFITLTTGILGYVSKNKQTIREYISLYIFRTIKTSSREVQT